MNSRQALNAYSKVGVQSGVTDASPHQLISMLIAGAQDRIAEARGAMERQQVARQGELVGKAISIVDNLRVSLDHSKGGELAGTLGDLYDYMQRRLVEANASSDPAILAEVHGLLGTVREGWEAIPAEFRHSAT
ncbi:MAG TPA: flagellar export chaperone FliS [Halieaceae bacterium]|jgi:flagellar protein FliS|nr:flagellar export chaperone FliS [Haliea sp.]HAN67599.1 flagellar export chaperone FliS [Halieaceae bacterium]MAY91422.1 flagellar export chaperone FliS [Haliea sp.]MBK41044.1 flagellar export chaperone FliS [Haliea sp.]MBP71064.1 flagellar export chaperone FliS [Haliea sp.]HBM83182.1 flagellar export chaperone FliS [Halieaceae bacterium]|tara:strand:- start:2095 stop:2496 length:402 start_codon:yes stop_codon:yes gene_type:complete